MSNGVLTLRLPDHLHRSTPTRVRADDVHSDRCHPQVPARFVTRSSSPWRRSCPVPSSRSCADRSCSRQPLLPADVCRCSTRACRSSPADRPDTRLQQSATSYEVYWPHRQLAARLPGIVLQASFSFQHRPDIFGLDAAWTVPTSRLITRTFQRKRLFAMFLMLCDNRSVIFTFVFTNVVQQQFLDNIHGAILHLA